MPHLTDKEIERLSNIVSGLAATDQLMEAKSIENRKLTFLLVVHNLSAHQNHLGNSKA